MLTKNTSITLPMRQSPDVKGVMIDFGGAPDHGRWHAMEMTITLRSPKTGIERKIKWRRRWRNSQIDGCFSRPREPYERVVKIRLDAWELKDE